MYLKRCSNALNTTISTPNTAQNSFRKLCAWLFSSHAFFQRFENAVAAVQISFHDFIRVLSLPLLRVFYANEFFYSMCFISRYRISNCRSFSIVV